MLSHASIWKAIDALARQHNISPSGLAKLAGLDPTTFNPSKRFKANGKPRWPSTESIAKVLDATNASPSLFFSRHLEPSSVRAMPGLETKSLAASGVGEQPASHVASGPNGPDLLPVPSGTVPLWLQECSSGISAQFEQSTSASTDRKRRIISQELPDMDLATQSSMDSQTMHGTAETAAPDAAPMDDFISFPAPSGEPVFALAICNDELEPTYHCGDMLLVSPEASLRFGDRVLAKSREGALSVHLLIRATARNLIVHSLDEPKRESILALNDLLWKARILWVSQ